MKTCTVCGRQSPDDVARCRYDGAMLVEGGDDTRVRARPAEPVGPPRFTVEDISRPATPVTPRAQAPATAERPVWPATVAIAVAATIGVAAFMYYLFSQRSREVDSINTQIADARIAVADAKARIESLPVENPLRQRIITLDKWDRELQAFQLGSERSSEMAARARDILTQAEQISDAARSAGATMNVKPVVPPATPTESLPPPEQQNAPPPPPDGEAAPNTNAEGESESADEPSSDDEKPPTSNANSNTSPGSQPLPPPPAPPPPSTNKPPSDNANRIGP
jgi:hypothetical protein